MNTLTLGGLSTGDIVIDSGTGIVQLADATASRFALTDANKNLVYSGLSSVLLNTLTDETGTGVAVFGTSPTFTTPLLVMIVERDPSSTISGPPKIIGPAFGEIVPLRINAIL